MLVKYKMVPTFTENLQNGPGVSNIIQQTKYLFNDMCALYNVLRSTSRKYCISNMYTPIIKTTYKSSR